MASTDEKIFNGEDLETYSALVKQSIENVENQIPTLTSLLINNSNFVADANYVHTDNNYTSQEKTKLSGIEAGAEVNVLSDWNAVSGDAFIKNKPNNIVTDASYVHTDNNYTTAEKNKLAGIASGAEVNVQSDWNQTTTTADDYIKNKPTNVSSFNNDAGYLTEHQDISGKLDVIPDLDTIRAGAAAGATAYQKPSTGIPKSDLSSSVLTSLGKADTALLQHQDLSSYADGAEYDSTNHLIYLKHGSTRLSNPIDATDFIKDGMVDTVTVTGGNLVITFNTDSGKLPITIPISNIFDANNYYNKTESDARYLLSYTETDPTVPSWAKLSTKPSYDYSEINNTPSIPTVPTNVSAFTNDAGYLTTHLDISGKQDVLTPGDGIAIDNTDTIRTTGIPFGRCDSTSTATVFTATVPGIYKLEDGVCCMIENGVVTSASGFTLNVNGLGGKPCYSNLAAATRDTTIFNVAYTMLFVYDETRVSGGCWICYRGYDANTNTIGYQVRSNSMSLPASLKFYRYRLLFTSADGTHYVPANTSTSTNATTSRTVNQTPIDPFGHIVYYGTTAAVEANARPAAANLWVIYTLTLGYSFNRTGAALTLDDWAPVYIKCAPQSDGSAIIDADTPYVQALPTTNDGKIYIFLGIAFSATNIELLNDHPVYYHDGTGIRLWTGKDCYSKTLIDTKLEDKQDVISIVDASVTIPSELESNTFYDFGTISTNILIPSLATPDDSSIVNIYAFCMTIDDTLTQAPSITLPQGVDLADELNINPGDYVEFSIMNNKAEAKIWQAQ